MKKKIVLILGIIIPLTIYFFMNIISPRANTAYPPFEMSSVHIKSMVTLGSVSYSNGIRILATRYGSKAALTKIMTDVDKYGSQIDKNKYEDNLRLYKLISFYVHKVGAIDMETHYFRNKLNRAPQTLKELLLSNTKLPANRRWKLLSPPNSLYHLQGKDGIYNLKFVSGDGFCEAVYNKLGVLLTEKNDPVNMGTFNYSAGIHQVNAHEKYDVSPYLKWGNTLDSPQKGSVAIQKGISLAAALYNEHASSVLQYRKKIMTAIFRKA